MYRTGDTVLLAPAAGENGGKVANRILPEVAVIEALFTTDHTSLSEMIEINMNAATDGASCRRFYRPEDTIFGARMKGEVFASRHLDECVPLQRVLGRCIVQYTADAGAMSGDGDGLFSCRFFYDHVAESLSRYAGI
jgi:hypothetical protein